MQQKQWLKQEKKKRRKEVNNDYSSLTRKNELNAAAVQAKKAIYVRAICAGKKKCKRSDGESVVCDGR